MKRATFMKYVGFPLITGVCLALVMNYLQNQTLQKAEQERVFDQVSELMDLRMYRMRRLVDAYQERQTTRDEIDARWREYSNIVEQWNYSLRKNYGRIQRYFGDDARKCFEVIHREFRTIGARLEYPYKNDMAVLDRELDLLNLRYHRFGLGLARDLGGWGIANFDDESCLDP